MYVARAKADVHVSKRYTLYSISINLGAAADDTENAIAVLVVLRGGWEDKIVPGVTYQDTLTVSVSPAG